MSFQPKVIKTVTPTQFKLVGSQTLYIRINAAIFTGKQLKGDKSNKKPAQLCGVTNLETGEAGQIVVPTVMESTLNEEYPDNAYVGKCFSITKGEKVQKPGVDVGYFKYRIEEIEDPAVQSALVELVQKVKRN